MFRPIVATIFIAFLLAGCGSKFTIKVDSISDQGSAPGGKNYVLYSGMSDVPLDDLHFREFSTYFRHILKTIGYREVGDRESAQLAIYFSYGISAGKDIYYSYMRPIYETVGGDTIRYTETRTDPSGATTHTTGTTRIPLHRQVVGMETERASYTLYTAFAVIEAKRIGDLQQGSEARTVWKTTIKSTGKSDDLRAIIPAMAAAAEHYLGENTGSQKTIRLYERDSKVKRMRELVISTNP